MWSVAAMMVLHVVRGCYDVLHVVRGCYGGLACGPWLLWWSCMWSVAVMVVLHVVRGCYGGLACGPWLL